MQQARQLLFYQEDSTWDSSASDRKMRFVLLIGFYALVMLSHWKQTHMRTTSDMLFPKTTPCAKPTKEYALYHRLIEIRREHAAFSEGGMQFLYAKGKTLAIARQDAAHTFVVLISSEEIPSPSWESGSRTQKWTFWENPSTLREQKKASCSLFRRRMPFCFRADDIWL